MSRVHHQCLILSHLRQVLHHYPELGEERGQVVGAIGRVSQQGERKRQRSEGEGKGEDGVVIGRGECFRVWKNAV